MKKSKRQLYKIDPIAHRLGEEHALQYIQTHIAPSVLYASEMMDMSMARQLDKQWENLLAEATLTGKANKWWSDEPYIRRASLRWHTTELLECAGSKEKSDAECETKYSNNGPGGRHISPSLMALPLRFTPETGEATPRGSLRW